MLLLYLMFPDVYKRQVINNRVSPGITDQIQIWIFVNNTGEIFLGVPAVTKDYDILLRSKRGHDLTHHGCGKLQFRLFFLPHAVTERDRQISNPAVAPYGDTTVSYTHLDVYKRQRYARPYRPCFRMWESPATSR